MFFKEQKKQFAEIKNILTKKMFFKEQKKFPGGVQKSGVDQKGGLKSGQ